MVLGEPTSAPTIQTNAKAFCPAEFINTLIEKIHPWHSVCIKAVTPWSVQFTLGSHRANFYASSESEGRVRVLTTWGSGVSMESLSQYADQMNGFAEHINGILEGKIRDDEGKLVEVLLHDKPQADGSIGVALSDGWPPYKDSLISQDLEKAKRKALNCGCPPILERRDKDGDIQYWDLEGGVLYDSRFNPVDPSLYEYVLHGTGNKQFDGKSCDALNYSKANGKCQVRVGESVTWVDSSMLWKPWQIQVVNECSSRADDPIESYAKTVRSDDDFAWAIFCNLAMMARDAGDPIEKANERSADLMRAWFGADVRKNKLWPKSASSHPEQTSTCVDRSVEERWIVGGQWTPKLGDLVRIKKPLVGCWPEDWPCWTSGMDKYDKHVLKIYWIQDRVIIHDDWRFHFDWLEPAEQPVIKQSLTTEPPDGWRWLELGEVIRKGDRCLTNNGGSIDCLTSVGEKFNHEAHYPTIRRNKFGVGEKVIDFCGQVWEVEYISDTGNRYRLKHKEVRDEGYGNSLAPYIEETT